MWSDVWVLLTRVFTQPFRYAMKRRDYSEAEEKLFKAFKIKDIILDNIVPSQVYRMMATGAFLKNQQGPHVEALRRGMKHLEDGGYRGNKTFDNLIEF